MPLLKERLVQTQIDLRAPFRVALDLVSGGGLARSLKSVAQFTESAEAYGSMSPDGKYFFFHRGFGDDTGYIFWVDAQIIETLRPKK